MSNHNSIAFVPLSSPGTFWHISDLHYDPTEEGKSCVKREAEIPTWGSQYCDSAYQLLESAVQAMKDIDNSADFLLWTGYASKSGEF